MNNKYHKTSNATKNNTKDNTQNNTRITAIPKALTKTKTKDTRTHTHTQPPQTTNQNDAKVIHVEQQMLQTILNCIEGLPCDWSRVCIE